MIQKAKEIIIRVYEKYIKFHCPECSGVMDSEFYDTEIDDMVYQCRVTVKGGCKDGKRA